MKMKVDSYLKGNNKHSVDLPKNLCSDWHQQIS